MIDAMRTLITGGAGFIGSHLAEALIVRGDRVIVLDDTSTGRAENLRAIDGHARLTWIRGSITDEAAVAAAIGGCDRIVHLAAAVGVRRILERQVDSISVNVIGTELVLRHAATRATPVFLASSSEVYGKGVSAPFREDDDALIGATSRHRWSYACGKMLDEFLALAFWRERGLPVRIGRFFNTTGPRQSARHGMVLPRLCRAALAGGPLEVHGDGAQTRCFLHVADCVAAVIALMDCDAAIGEVVNIGSRHEVAIRDLARMVAEAAGTGTAIRLVPYDEAFPQGGFEDLRRRVPDVSKLTRLTGWRESHDLAGIVRACLDDCRARADAIG
ncbi:MAG: GDP-mannose 4,6-dehydratase [Planctomycetes bacterium]|nr:GDP-mannose 4,6-dehydratase [Planctomycetota bacterium]